MSLPLGKGYGDETFARFATFVQSERKKRAFKHTPSRKNAYLCNEAIEVILWQKISQ